MGLLRGEMGGPYMTHSAHPQQGHGPLYLASENHQQPLNHDLRQTWASWHVTIGTSLQELMELGGRKSYEMVLRYAHLAR